MQLALKQLMNLPTDAEFTPGILLTIAPGTSLMLETVSWQAAKSHAPHLPHLGSPANVSC